MVTHNKVHKHGGKEEFSALDLIICLKHIKYQRLLLTCAPISKFQSNISTMGIPLIKKQSTQPRYVIFYLFMFGFNTV